MIEFKKAITKEHYQVISDLAKIIWTEHYIKIISKEQVSYMLEKFQSITAIEKQILEECYHYYTVYHNYSVIGYLAIKKENTSLFLSKIYITKEHRGQGIGKNTINFIFDQATDLDCKRVYLTVNKYNKNTIKAYENMGFKKTEELIIDIGNGYIMDDYKMVKNLIN